MNTTIHARRYSMEGPDDVTGLAHDMEQGVVHPEDIIAVMGKTEGNGGVNDFTRGFSTLALATLIGKPQGLSVEQVEGNVAFVMSGGTEGVLSPHYTVFTQVPSESTSEDKRLAVAVAFTRELLPEEIGRQAQIDETARAVREAMASAGIDDPADVHFVQVKCPLLTNSRMEDARGRGKDVVTTETYKSMGYSRGASALGIAVGLGEIDTVDESAVARDYSVYSDVASTSAGVELLQNVVILMGNSPQADGDLVIGHAVMQDAIDIGAVHRVLADVGLSANGSLSEADAARVVNVFAKAEADPSGSVRGRRHTMLTDTDVSATRHARGAVGALIAAVVGDPMVYVSGGAEHQGPSGGGPIAVIASTS